MNDKQKHIWLPLIVSLVATIIGGAVADGLYNLWPGFWAFFGVLIYSVLGLGLVLAVHNIYYHATFHTLSYFIHYVTKDTEGALKSLQRINHIRPNDPYPLIQQALILLKQKNLSDALSTVDRAQLLVGERYDVLELRKEILWQLGQRQDSLHLDTWKDVAETLEKMIRIAKDKEDLHYQLAEVYFYLGKYKRGISKLTRLITRLMENAKSLEDKSQFSAAERKMWIAVDVQKNSIAILEKAIPNIQTTVSEYPPGLLVYLDKLTDALHKIKVFSAGTIEACYSSSVTLVL